MQTQRISEMSPFEMVDTLVQDGEINEKAAKLIVDMFSGKSSPEMKKILDAMQSELMRTDLATKADLIEALTHYATKADLIERINKSESNLRNWIIGCAALLAALTNSSKILAALGLG